MAGLEGAISAPLSTSGACRFPSSANRFGAVSPTTAQAREEGPQAHLQQTDLILDGGQCLVGLESTILDCTGPTPSILRLGVITPPLTTEESIRLIVQDQIPTPNGVLHLAAPITIEEYARVLHHSLVAQIKGGIDVVVVLHLGGGGLPVVSKTDYSV